MANIEISNNFRFQISQWLFRVIGDWNLGFICYLDFGYLEFIWDWRFGDWYLASSTINI
jgi:hypothetical protein